MRVEGVEAVAGTGVELLGARDVLDCHPDLAGDVAQERGPLQHVSPPDRLVAEELRGLEIEDARFVGCVEALGPLGGLREQLARPLGVVAVAVVGRDGGNLLLAAVLLQPGADLPVQFPPSRHEQATVRHLVHERVAHPVRRAVEVAASRHDQLVALEGGQGIGQVRGGLDRGERPLSELHADHRRHPEQVARVRRQPVDPRQQHLVDRLRQGRAAGIAGAHQLLEEERVPTGPMEQRLRPLRLDVVARCERGHQLAGLVVAQPVEVHLLVVRATRPSVRPAGPMERQHEDRGLRHHGEQLVEDGEGRGIGPVEVVEHDELRLDRGPGADHGGQRLDEEALAGVGGDVGEDGALRFVRVAGDVGEDRRPTVEGFGFRLRDRGCQRVTDGSSRGRA